MIKYIDIQKTTLKNSYHELGKIKNMCSCKKKHIKNYSEDLSQKWKHSWNIIHNFPINIPIEMNKCDKNELQNIYKFFDINVSNITCKTCKGHYEKYIKNNPINICKNRIELFNWTINLHNDINIINKKKIFSKKEIYDLFDLSNIANIKELKIKYTVNDHIKLKVGYETPTKIQAKTEIIKNSSSVISITKGVDEFQQFINNKRIAIVNFYAPWCGYCKKFYPHYEKASDILKEKGSKAILVKVDGTIKANNLLKKNNSISRFPTIKLFHYGKFIMNYAGKRDSNGIVNTIINLENNDKRFNNKISINILEKKTKDIKKPIKKPIIQNIVETNKSNQLKKPIIQNKTLIELKLSNGLLTKYKYFLIKKEKEINEKNNEIIKNKLIEDKIKSIKNTLNTFIIDNKKLLDKKLKYNKNKFPHVFNMKLDSEKLKNIESEILRNKKWHTRKKSEFIKIYNLLQSVK